MAAAQLQKVADWEQQKEDKCAQDFHQAQQYLQQQRMRLESIERYRLEYINSISQVGKSGFDAKKYTQHLNFVAQLDNACQQQNSVISQAILVADQRKQTWLAQQRKRRAIEYLIEKQQQQLAAREAKLEQLQLDEFALQSHLRRQRQAI